ncbi:unnamed protein product [Rotaria sp. Silwood2]|nr:unnamed protein product [Rotaria sp. Silwood2]CAF3198190.1 unnamed protein product [Rotaria sp. Silwood2]CAF3390726.1 unnamed protein product [Rotaria sp. Silwood2]CAF4357161.1 unnamed protein product [Rotaria sp. Silwood2]CAF4384364.1 unnamed protein product [Rotaria sp. Silwood2]
MDKKQSKPSGSGSSSSLSSSATSDKPKSTSLVPSSTSGGGGGGAAVAASIGQSGITKTTERNTMLSRPMCRVLRNFLLVWLDATFNESKEDWKNSIQLLRQFVITITTFTDVDESIDFLNDTENEKVFMIVSESLEQHIIPEI